jgi:uncharacterized metal-binding protein YceD (DUF177 family)
MTSELSRPISLSKIAPSGLSIVVQATPEECAAIAIRMDIPGVSSLTCLFDLAAEDDGRSIFARGRLRARLIRICVVSAEEFETTVEDEFEIRFVPEGEIQDDPDPNQPDEIPYEFDTIDLGEAAVEQLGLALDPYPRIDGAVMPVTEDNDNASPFSVLARRSGPDKTRH